MVAIDGDDRVAVASVDTVVVTTSTAAAADAAAASERMVCVGRGYLTLQEFQQSPERTGGGRGAAAFVVVHGR